MKTTRHTSFAIILVFSLVAGLTAVQLPVLAMGTLAKASAKASPASVAPGGHGTLTVTIAIAPKAHVNAHKVPDPAFIPTVFVPAQGPGVKLGTPRYPAGHATSTGGIAQSVYMGTASISVPFTVARTAKPGTMTVGGKLTYQACNETLCLPPATIPLQATVTVK